MVHTGGGIPYVRNVLRCTTNYYGSNKKRSSKVNRALPRSIVMRLTP